LNVTYYVKTIVSGTNFTISTIQYGDVFDTTADNGIMDATGEAYVTVANVLTDETGTGTKYLTQVVGTVPEFDVSYILGGYRVAITNMGSGYTFDNQITIPGTVLGGISPENDLILTVTGIDVIVPNPDTMNPWKLPVESNGNITAVICAGNPVAITTTYYLKTITETQVEVYSNSLMTIPVSGNDFPYVGVTTTTATAIDGSSNITVADASNIDVADSVTFTGNVFGGLVPGESYYVVSSDNVDTIAVSTTLNGSPIGTSGTGSMTVGKIGDFALLPEPFFFNTSIVKYGNRVYQCIVSNNDEEFIFGKWQLLESSDRKLNALDRIIGYYQPTVNMPGLDLTQLVNGITYPNSTYKGNAFAPADEFTLDTILSDAPFYPRNIDVVGVIWNGLTYVAVANTPDYSTLLFSTDTETWTIDEIAKLPISITSILNTGGKYIVTTNNNATPVLVSDDGYSWSNITSLSGNTYNLNKIAYYNGVYVAVGDVVVTSTDLINWEVTYVFTNQLVNQLNDVAWVNTSGFIGFVAVGLGQRIVGNQAQPVAIIRTSTNGYNWTEVQFTDTTSGFNAVAGTSNSIVTVGDDGVVYTSFNSQVWFAQPNAGSDNLNSLIWNNTNSLFVAVGENGSIQTAGIEASSWTAQTPYSTEELNSVMYNSVDSKYIAVGYNNTIIRSDDAISWTDSVDFITPSPAYTIQGDAFTAGYGPEELVPGVVTDTLTMIVSTRPGTNWDATVYQHVGYNVVSTEIAPTSASQTVYSFKNLVSTPAQLAVFVIDFTSGLSSSLYENTDYTIDWISNTITLSTPVAFTDVGSSDKVRIDVYEVGNGDQLVKANTETDPIRFNETTGFYEI
jgi:hypothetical protein